MGGMQAFEWMTTHPDFIDRAVAIAGSPRLSEDERRSWLELAEQTRKQSPVERAFEALRRWDLPGGYRAIRDRPIDVAKQAEALATTDVSTGFAGSLAAAAAAVRARALVVVPERDEVVDPTAAREFARLTGAQVLVLDGRCGHDAPACEGATLWPAVNRFVGEADQESGDAGVHDDPVRRSEP
jgi:homoserine O-acetyltransferase